MKDVILVEDDPHNVTVFRKLLEKRVGCAVRVTESPAELFAWLRRPGAGLVLMDVSLARSLWEGRPVGGAELCRMIKSDPATAHVPVLLATAHAMRGDAERLVAESGADGYIAKPVTDHDAFASLVRQWLEAAA